MAKKSKSKKSTMIYLAAILFSALVIGMAFLPVFTYKTAVGPTHINGFQMMQGAFSEKIEGSIASLVRTLISNAENVKTAAIFILVAIIFAGLSALSALAGLFAGKSWRMVQFLLMAVCFPCSAPAAASRLKNKNFRAVPSGGRLRFFAR